MNELTDLYPFMEKRVHVIATRDADNQPTIGILIGVKPIDDDRVAIMIAEQYFEAIAQNLQENGAIAIMGVEPTTLESYQFKGHFERFEDDPKLFNELVALALPVLAEHVRNVCEAYRLPPPGDPTGKPVATPKRMAIVKITQVFRQTPGPGAGAELRVKA